MQGTREPLRNRIISLIIDDISGKKIITKDANLSLKLNHSQLSERTKQIIPHLRLAVVSVKHNSRSKRISRLGLSEYEQRSSLLVITVL